MNIRGTTRHTSIASAKAKCRYLNLLTILSNEKLLAFGLIAGGIDCAEGTGGTGGTSGGTGGIGVLMLVHWSVEYTI